MKTNNRIILGNKIIRLAEIQNRPSTGKGSLGFHYEGTQSGTYCLYERAHETSGAIRVIYRDKTVPHLIAYCNGVIDGLQRERNQRGELYERYMNS